MSIDVKICGLMNAQDVDVCVESGARYVGFVFCKPSRHNLSPDAAVPLVAQVPKSSVGDKRIEAVGLFLNPTNFEIDLVLNKVPLTMLQLHGTESPDRVAKLKERTGLPVIKAIHIGAPKDVETVDAYGAIADILLFDTRLGSAPTGGTGKTFDWTLLRGATFARPWMLAGGLNAQNIAQAVAETGARTIDVSSGVEAGQGRKSPEKIRALLALAENIG